MNGLTWIDLLLRILPEAMLIILAGYAVSKNKINLKLFLLSSIIQAAITFGLKSLPISAALPIILSATSAILLLVFINKIRVLHAIISTIVCLILTVLLEGITFYVLDKILKVDTYSIFTDVSPMFRILCGLPSLLVFGLIVIVFHLISRRKTERYESYE